ncbi:unnamed protein product [Polarella glacialis]|uniref:Uncharacterized protein n=1 Tax=Polarella glacialis TaxID=89957 RepID=A0A813FT90_POLGL|nr:unnamed protein product [Polarella glacialis]
MGMPWLRFLLLLVAVAQWRPHADALYARSSEEEMASCLAAAETEIARSPDKDELHVTTSWLYKRDVARYFCAIGSRQLSVIELGVYQGHTTAVLASIFGQVIAVDIESEYLRASLEHNRDRRNIVFLTLDTYADDWNVLRANNVNVAVIDADHKYEKVRTDAHHALSYLAPVDYLVFDDFGMEVGVRKAVGELVEAKALHDCQPVGRGKDESPWLLKGYGWINHTEGVICRRGAGSHEAAVADYLDIAFLLYAQPSDSLMRASSVISFQAEEQVLGTSTWGRGTWARNVLEEPRKLQLSASLPGLPNGSWDVIFNRPRTAFLMSQAGDAEAKVEWFGLRADKVNQVFITANEFFE